MHNGCVSVMAIELTTLGSIHDQTTKRTVRKSISPNNNLAVPPNKSPAVVGTLMAWEAQNGKAGSRNAILFDFLLGQ